MGDRPNPDSEGVYDFIAAIEGNVLDKGISESISLVFSDPFPTDVNPDTWYIAVRTFQPPYVAVWYSELVRHHPAFNVFALLQRAIAAALEMESESS